MDNRVAATSTAMPRSATPAPDSAVQVRTAESTSPTPEQCIRLVLEAGIFQDPDGGPDSLIVTTDQLACEPVVPARLRGMVADARARLDQMERLANEYEAQETLRAILDEHRLVMEEWDPANLTPWLRDHLAMFCMLGGDCPTLVVLKGQDPIERVSAVVKLINAQQGQA